MQRFLITYADDNGAAKAVVLSVQPEHEPDFPFGVFANTNLLDQLPDCNDASTICMMELAEYGLIPTIFDLNDDSTIEPVELTYGGES